MSIRLSEKHGVNPSLMQCFGCMKEFGVALLGRLPSDREAPRIMCRPDWFCKECEDLMRQGVMFISVRDGEEGSDNPWRTGRIAVLKDEAVKRGIQPQELCDSILAKRLCFVPDSVWDALGLPREDVDNRPKPGQESPT